MEMKTKSLFIAGLLLSIVFLSGCGGSYNGQLLGELDRPRWQPEMPYGMIYVPTGFLHVGPSDQDVNHALVTKNKSISIVGFFMDDTEITNNEYRQFEHWVRDSIAHKLMEHVIVNDETGEESIDWDQEIDWESQETKDMLGSMNLPASDPLKPNSVDPRKLIYEYVWIDWQTAADVKDIDREELLIKEETPIYPDTLVWIRDFSYSYNEPMARNYYGHPAFDDYPVVGVNWDQANAFTAWRTRYYNDYKKGQGLPLIDDFRLPTEHEWEYAARGGKDQSPYPWGGHYIRNSKGCLLANFKPGRGNYPEDGGLYTVRADAYWPNDFGLYNMAGNVAEWTSSAYYENSYNFVHDLNPDIRYDVQDGDPEAKMRKVLRGGSWKDIGYYIQTGTRHWDYSNVSKSYIGFRCVSTYLGRDYRDNSN
ncbi:MAG: SUMF1/EgtB/PvdO family nonheme iron enzyme [Chitinophagales bacterium]